MSNSIIAEISVDNYKIPLIQVPLDDIVKSHTFSGSKIPQCYKKEYIFTYKYSSLIFKNGIKNDNNVIGLKIMAIPWLMNSNCFKDKQTEDEILNANLFEFKFNCGMCIYEI